MDKREQLFKMLVEADYMVAGDVVPRSPAERERLYELIVDAENKFFAETPCGTDTARIEKVVDHLLENGVILPPVKVGQTVYFLHYNELCEAKVVSMEINLYTHPQLWLSLEYYSPMFGTHQYKSRVDLLLGKLLFFTREEAEAAIRHRERKNT